MIEKMGFNVENLPLSAYRELSFYTMRTDALDRFGTRLEQRFTRAQIEQMMESAGLEKIKFSEDLPFWCGGWLSCRFGVVCKRMCGIDGFIAKSKL